MAVYIVSRYNITDPEMYQKYVGKAVPLIAKYGGEILAVDKDSEVLEGSGNGVDVLLKFSSREAAQGWYNDPEYVEAVKQRHASTNDGHVMIVNEFVPPSE